MSNFLPHTLLNNHFLLTSQRCIFWEEEKALIMSDLHLGKAGHFRKSGIGIPQSIFIEDMQRLLSEIQFYKPKYIIVIGDLFHSTSNKEHLFFEKWRNDILHSEIHLVKGNHDILKNTWYVKNNIRTYETELSISSFSFTHDISCKPSAGYCFSGHIHPGIVLNGKGRQSLRFACFYFGAEYAILPAFGKFTGTANIRPASGDDVYIIAGDIVMPLVY